MRLPTIIALLFASAASLTAQEPYLVKDIGKGLPPVYHKFADNKAATFKGDFYFASYSRENGVELWRTDGTHNSAKMFIDIAKGSESSYPAQLVTCGDNLFFTTKSDKNTTLWVTDGTVDGTSSIRSFMKTGCYGLTTVGNRIFFSGHSAVEGRELWISDGTKSGTKLVKDINDGAGSSDPHNFCMLGNVILFTARESKKNSELWKSDGTSDGTVLVKDLYPGLRGAQIGPMRRVGSHVYFVSLTSNSRRLVMSDGTEAGTVVAIDYGEDNKGFEQFSIGPIFMDNSVYLTSSLNVSGAKDYYVIRLTPGLTTPEAISMPFRLPSGTNGANGCLFSIIRKPNNTWVLTTIGAKSGKILFEKILAGRDFFNVKIENLYSNDKSVYFTINGDLWVYDSKTEGPRRIVQSEFQPHILEVGTNSALYTRTDKNHNTIVCAYENSKETKCGAVLVANSGSNPKLLASIGSRVVFTVKNTAWSSDGTASGTSRIARNDEAIVFNAITGCIEHEDRLYFTSKNSLCSTDGTTAGTRLVSTPNRIVKYYSDLCVMGGHVYFVSLIDKSMYGLYKYEASTMKTTRVSEFSSSAPRDLFAVDDMLYFRVSGNNSYSALYVTDGSASGTRLVKDFSTNKSRAEISEMISFKGSLYFTASDNGVHLDFWRSDGTEKGTVVIKASRHTFDHGVTSFVFNEQLYFSIHGKDGFSLFRTNGSSKKYELVYSNGPIISQYGYAGFKNAVVVGDTAYFVGYPEKGKATIFKIIGETGKVREFLDFDLSGKLSNVSNLQCVDNTLYFVVRSIKDGATLWKSNGRKPNSKEVLGVRIHGGFGKLIYCNGLIYYRSDSGFLGSELWAFSPSMGLLGSVSFEMSSNATTFLEGSPGASVASMALISGPDRMSLNRYSIEVSYHKSGPSFPQDALYLSNTRFSVQQGDIYLDSTVIGSIDLERNGQNGKSIRILLQAACSMEDAQLILNSIYFKNTSSTPNEAARQLDCTLIAPDSKKIGSYRRLISVTSVNSPPVISNIAVFDGNGQDEAIEFTLKQLLDNTEMSDKDSQKNIVLQLHSIVAGSLRINNHEYTGGSLNLDSDSLASWLWHAENPGKDLPKDLEPFLGEILFKWTPLGDDYGKVESIKIKAWDGEDVSNKAITVIVNTKQSKFAKEVKIIKRKEPEPESGCSAIYANSHSLLLLSLMFLAAVRRRKSALHK